MQCQATVNGIGTHYYGKRNRSTRTGVCRACGNKAALESYDTRLWVVVLFIPVIPLGRKRIINQCGSARGTSPPTSRSSRRARQLNVAGVKDRYREQPSPENALEVHACLLAFRQHDEAEQFRRQVLLQHADSAVLHGGLASHLVEVGQVNSAIPLFEKAYVPRPDLPEARVGMARIRMANGRLDEARELLGFLTVAGAGQLYSPSRWRRWPGYREAGRHAATLTLCKHLLMEFPAVGEDRGFRKFVAASEKASEARERLAQEERLAPRPVRREERPQLEVAAADGHRRRRGVVGGRRIGHRQRVPAAAPHGLRHQRQRAARGGDHRRRRIRRGQRADEDPTRRRAAPRARGEPVNDEFEFEMGSGDFELDEDPGLGHQRGRRRGDRGRDAALRGQAAAFRDQARGRRALF